jgi:hypothetical protein
MAACQHCGREAHERDQFCQYCGHRLDSGATEPEQPALVAAVMAGMDGADFADHPPEDAASTPDGMRPTPALWRSDDVPSMPGMPAAIATGMQMGSATDGASDAPDASAADAPGDVSEAADTSDDATNAPDVPPDDVPDAADTPAQEPDHVAAAPKNRLLIRKAASERDTEREEILGDRDIAIGRSPSCDIVLEGDELASRRHALIRARGGRYTLVDLGSSNGTYVNGYEIHGESELHDGDRIAVGSHELLFTLGEPGPNASLAGERASSLAPRPAATTLHRDALADGPDAAGATAGSDQAREDAGTSSVSRAESKTAPLSAATPEELEALRLQIADIAGALARKADAESRAAQHYHSALAEVRDQLEALRREVQARQEQEELEREQRGQLAAMARDAADHPRHLDYLTRLAENAGAIADSLNTVPTSADVLDALGELLTRINESMG